VADAAKQFVVELMQLKSGAGGPRDQPAANFGVD